MTFVMSSQVIWEKWCQGKGREGEEGGTWRCSPRGSGRKRGEDSGEIEKTQVPVDVGR